MVNKVRQSYRETKKNSQRSGKKPEERFPSSQEISRMRSSIALSTIERYNKIKIEECLLGLSTLRTGEIFARIIFNRGMDNESQLSGVKGVNWRRANAETS